MSKLYCIELLVCLFLMPMEQCCYNKELSINTIVVAYGPMLVAVIQNQTKLLPMLQQEDCKKKWVFVTSVHPAFQFLYKANFENGLTEHEYDHVFIGTYNGAINLNTEEVENYCFKTINEIEVDISTNPTTYTAWFKIALPKVKAWLQQNNYQYA
jgi:isopentenyldiphosphate isomerase